jgi:hypothetical protein
MKTPTRAKLQMQHLMRVLLADAEEKHPLLQCLQNQCRDY